LLAEARRGRGSRDRGESVGLGGAGCGRLCGGGSARNGKRQSHAQEQADAGRFHGHASSGQVMPGRKCPGRKGVRFLTAALHIKFLNLFGRGFFGGPAYGLDRKVCLKSKATLDGPRLPIQGLRDCPLPFPNGVLSTIDASNPLRRYQMSVLRPTRPLSSSLISFPNFVAQRAQPDLLPLETGRANRLTVPAPSHI